MRSPRCKQCKSAMRPHRGKISVDSVKVSCSYMICRCGHQMTAVQEHSVERKIRRIKHLHDSVPVTHFHHN